MSDLISRQAAIEATYDVLASYSYIDEPGSDVAERVENILKEMPSVQQKTGRWIFEKGDGETCVDGYMCSVCGRSFHTKVPYFSEYNFCPNCGAKMEGEAK